jgi:hypothetical protein
MVLRVGSQIWHGLLPFKAPGAKQLPPTTQPWHWHWSAFSLHASPSPQLRFPFGEHTPPWHASPTVQNLASSQGVELAATRARQLPRPLHVSEPSQALLAGLPHAAPSARWLGWHWPWASQVSCPEHTPAGAPQDLPLAATKAEVERAGSQMRHGLPGSSAPAAWHVPDTTQPAQVFTQAPVAASHAELAPH